MGDGGGGRKPSLAENAALIVAARLMTIVGVPIAGFFGAWAFVTLVNLSQEVAVMRVQIDVLTAHAYTSIDATKDFALRDIRIDANSGDIKILQRRVDSVEDPSNQGKQRDKP